MATLSTSPPTQPDIDVIAVSGEQASYVDWSAVFAGTAIASAMSLLLYSFGASVGLYVAQPWSNAAATTTAVSMAVIIFVALAYIYSLALGSYFTGRMRPRHSFNADESQFRDGASGLIVWAISLIVGALIASNVLVGAADRIATAGYRTAAGVSSAVAPFAESAVDSMLRAPNAGPSKMAAAPAPAATPAPQAAAAPEAGSPATESVATSNTSAASTLATTPPSANAEGNSANLTEQQREQIGRIVMRSLGKGEISEADKQYLANVLENQFGYDPEQALITVNQKMDQALQETEEFLVEAKANTAFAGFWTAVVVLLSGLASWWAATLGGAHRDEAARHTEYSTLVTT